LSDPDLDRALTEALAEPPQRVRAVVLPDGRRFWLKRVERLSGRLRLQKGDPGKAFAVEREGLTLIPLELYFVRGRAKIRIALGKGKKLHDKRDDSRKRDADREIARAMRRR
jgi:hypothetical protein